MLASPDGVSFRVLGFQGVSIRLSCSGMLLLLVIHSSSACCCCSHSPNFHPRFHPLSVPSAVSVVMHSIKSFQTLPYRCAKMQFSLYPRSPSVQAANSCEGPDGTGNSCGRFSTAISWGVL